MRTKLSPLIALVLAGFSTVTFAQLPADLKSDLGPDVPAFKVRPGYRVTRAVPDDAIRPGAAGRATTTTSQPTQAQRRVRRGARFLQFSPDGKTLFLSQSENGTILALRNP